MSQDQVVRIVRRRVKPGCEKAYEAMIAGMFEDAKNFPGYLAASLIPPAVQTGEYQTVQRFASAEDLERWNLSEQRKVWAERLMSVAENDPEYRVLHGLEVWFGAANVPVSKPPARWKMCLVSWLGIFPVVASLLFFLAPWIAHWPFLLRTAVITALVALLMPYVVMPRLTRLFSSWLRL
jgi:antibiotic biosynthesis monooxygenase (ABM) superfamily enzyme